MLLASNKPTIVRQAVATAGPEEEKIKKFATAIVEFSKVRKRLKSRKLCQWKGHAQMVCHSLFDHSKCSIYFGLFLFISLWFVLFVVVTQPPTRSPQKSRRGETGHDEKEDAEIAARNKQEMYSRPPPTHKKSIAPSTVSRRVINCTKHVNLLLLFFYQKLLGACHKFNVSILCLSSSDSYSFFLCLLNLRGGFIF